MGAGLYGGFGYTAGYTKEFLQYYKYGQAFETQLNYTRDNLIDFIDGITSDSSNLAKYLRERKIKLNVLGDSLFEKYLGVDNRIVGMAIGNQIYLRASATNIYSNLVHEGVHAMDSFGKQTSKDIISWAGEYRAYLAEHRFQKAKGLKLEFADENEIKVHVALNYKRLGGKL